MWIIQVFFKSWWFLYYVFMLVLTCYHFSFQQKNKAIFLWNFFALPLTDTCTTCPTSEKYNYFYIQMYNSLYKQHCAENFRGTSSFTVITMIPYILQLIKKNAICNNSYMIYIIRNPILWLGIHAYGGGVFVSLFFDRRCSPDYFFRNVNKMAAWIPDNKKR